jgi:hypothetical protein
MSLKPNSFPALDINSTSVESMNERRLAKVLTLWYCAFAHSPSGRSELRQLVMAPFCVRTETTRHIN